jgi:membrane-associated phospholipid phosphatase
MGIPSSHAAVAFGGAFMLLRLFPGAGIIALLGATGCATTRILLGAHYLSDVLVAAALGLLASELCSKILKPTHTPP